MRFHLYFRQYCSTIDMFVKSFQACRTGSSSFALREISISLIQGMRNLLFPIDVLDNKKGEPAGKEAFHGPGTGRIDTYVACSAQKRPKQMSSFHIPENLIRRAISKKKNHFTFRIPCQS